MITIIRWGYHLGKHDGLRELVKHQLIWQQKKGIELPQYWTIESFNHYKNWKDNIVENWVLDPSTTLKMEVKGILSAVFQAIQHRKDQITSTISFQRNWALRNQTNSSLILVWKKLPRRLTSFRTRIRSRAQLTNSKRFSFNHMSNQPNSSKKINNSHNNLQSFVSKHLINWISCSVVAKILWNSYRKEQMSNTASYRLNNFKLKNNVKQHSLNTNKIFKLRFKLLINN